MAANFSVPRNAASLRLRWKDLKDLPLATTAPAAAARGAASSTAAPAGGEAAAAAGVAVEAKTLTVGGQSWADAAATDMRQRAIRYDLTRACSPLQNQPREPSGARARARAYVAVAALMFFRRVSCVLRVFALHARDRRLHGWLRCCGWLSAGTAPAAPTQQGSGPSPAADGGGGAAAAAAENVGLLQGETRVNEEILSEEERGGPAALSSDEPTAMEVDHAAGPGATAEGGPDAEVAAAAAAAAAAGDGGSAAASGGGDGGDAAPTAGSSCGRGSASLQAAAAASAAAPSEGDPS
jgi:hypothetical protein